MKPNSDAIQMLYPPTPENIWLTDCFDKTCTIGSGDYALAAGIPIEIGRLFAAAPDLLAALRDLLDEADLNEIDEYTAPKIEAARAAIARATGDQTVNV